MLRREAEKNQQLSGKLLVRIRGGRLSSANDSTDDRRRRRVSDIFEETLTCEVEYDGKKASCSTKVASSNGGTVAESTRDAVLDVAEYHGGSMIKISLSVTRQRGKLSSSASSSTRRRSSRLIGVVSAPVALILSKVTTSPRPIAEVLVPLRDALPRSHRELVKQVASAYESGSSAGRSSSINAGQSFKKTSVPAASSDDAKRFLRSAGLDAGWWNGYGGVAPESWRDYWPTVHVPIADDGKLEIAVLFVPIIPPEKSLGGFTELHKAAYLGDSELASVLLAPRCGSNAQYRTRDALGFTALDIAALLGHLGVVLEIVADMGRISFQSSYQSAMDRRTSLHYAVLGGNPLVVSCLADHFGSSMFTTVRKPVSSSSSPPLTSSMTHAAQDRRSSSSFSEDEHHLHHHSSASTESVRCLVIDVEDANGWTALMMACEKEEMAEAVSRLVDVGANPELTNKAGDTALIIACRAGNVECAKALLHARAPNAPPESTASLARPNRANHAGDRALDRAAGSKSCPELIKALLNAHAVPGLRRQDGSTALHVAAQAGLMDNCRALVDWLHQERHLMETSKASLSHFVGSAIAQSLDFILLKDVYGRLASECANQAGHRELAEWLRGVEASEAQKVAEESAGKTVSWSLNEPPSADDVDSPLSYDYYEKVNDESEDNDEDDCNQVKDGEEEKQEGGSQ